MHNIVKRGERSKHLKEQTKIPRFMYACWNLYHAQSFVLRSYTMHELRNQNILLVNSYCRSVVDNCFFVHGQGQLKKENKKGFVEFHNHSPPLTMCTIKKLSSVSGTDP